MQRRDLLMSAAALPLLGTPLRGVLHRSRFALALERVVDQKARERKVMIPVGALQERVKYSGKVAAVVDHVREEVIDELPWWRVAFDAIVKWITENWDTIVAVLVKIAPLFLLLL